MKSDKELHDECQAIFCDYPGSAIVRIVKAVRDHDRENAGEPVDGGKLVNDVSTAITSCVQKLYTIDTTARSVVLLCKAHFQRPEPVAVHPPHDEQHCSCVPFLQKRIAELEALESGELNDLKFLGDKTISVGDVLRLTEKYPHLKKLIEMDRAIVADLKRHEPVACDGLCDTDLRAKLSNILSAGKDWTIDNIVAELAGDKQEHFTRKPEPVNPNAAAEARNLAQMQARYRPSPAADEGEPVIPRMAQCAHCNQRLLPDEQSRHWETCMNHPAHKVIGDLRARVVDYNNVYPLAVGSCCRLAEKSEAQDSVIKAQKILLDKLRKKIEAPNCVHAADEGELVKYLEHHFQKRFGLILSVLDILEIISICRDFFTRKPTGEEKWVNIRFGGPSPIVWDTLYDTREHTEDHSGKYWEADRPITAYPVRISKPAKPETPRDKLTKELRSYAEEKRKSSGGRTTSRTDLLLRAADFIEKDAQ